MKSGGGKYRGVISKIQFQKYCSTVLSTMKLEQEEKRT